MRVPWYIFLIVRSKPTQKTHYNINLMKKKNCNFRLQYGIEAFTKPPLFQRNILTYSGNPPFESCLEVKAQQR